MTKEECDAVPNFPLPDFIYETINSQKTCKIDSKSPETSTVKMITYKIAPVSAEKVNSDATMKMPPAAINMVVSLVWYKSVFQILII